MNYALSSLGQAVRSAAVHAVMLKSFPVLGPGIVVLLMMLARPAAGAPAFTNCINLGIGAGMSWTGGTAPFLVQKKVSLTDSNWVNVMTTSNRTLILAREAQNAFFRLQDQTTNVVLPFAVYMNAASEVPAVGNSTGTGIGALSLEGSNLNYYISFSGLSGSATAAHFHAPATPTNTASVSIPLSPPAAAAGAFSRSVFLTLSQITNLINGLTYLNIHTSLNPGGEIRGQVVPLRMLLAMNAASEVPATTSTGTANGVLTFIGSQLYYSITYSGLSANATAAHIHGPAATTNSANVLIPLTTPAGTSGTISGTASLTPQQMAYLLAGQTYVNIHTTANSGGEIRGQVWPIQFGAMLNGANEVPAIATAGTGTGGFTIISNLLTYTVTFTNLTSNANNGHIHGPADAAHTAGVLIPFSGVPAATSGAVSGTAILTAQQLFDIIAGLTYANIHTVNNGGGEIRGQLYPSN